MVNLGSCRPQWQACHGGGIESRLAPIKPDTTDKTGTAASFVAGGGSAKQIDMPALTFSL